MNDEENRTSNEGKTQSACPEKCDPLPEALPCENPHTGNDCDTEHGRAECGDGSDADGRDRDGNDERIGTEAVSDDPLQDADPSPAPDPTDTDPTDPSEQLEQLRNELKALRAEIAARDERLSRMSAEYAEFRTLYPHTSFDALDDSVMEDVKRGIPIAAAYALAERRRACAEARAAASNEENSRRTSGAIRSTDEDYYSPDEVRKMTRSEVRANYPKILASMKKWH